MEKLSDKSVRPGKQKLCAMPGSNLRLVAAATAQKLNFADVAGLVIFNFYFLIAFSRRAISSVVEHLLHTQGVAGSIPASRTLRKTALAPAAETKELAILDKFLTIQRMSTKSEQKRITEKVGNVTI